MGTKNEIRIGPSDISVEDLKTLQRFLDGEVHPVLLTTGGDPIKLPQALNDLLMTVVVAMSHKQAVFLMHEDEAFTTQAAANYLGVSRQFLIRLLEEGAIPYHQAGTHRRVFFKDLVVYHQNRSKQRKAGLDSMIENLVENGVYDRFTNLERGESAR